MPTPPTTAQKPAPPCNHTSPEDSCAFCRLAARDPRYAALFGKPQATKTAALPANTVHRADGIRCVHFGADTGWTVECPSCPKPGAASRGVQLKTFGCAVHGQCTPTKAAPGVQCCRTCPDFEAPDPTTPEPDLSRHFPVRDCLYHLYPLPTGGRIWRRCLSMLLARSHLFTGRKVISCMTAGHLEPPSVVRAMAEPHGFEVVAIANSTGLRESKTLSELLPRFETDDPERALFVGHSKGVTRPDNPGVSCHPWSVLCHEICLDFWPLVERSLQSYAITGPFKKVGKGFQGSASAWHYSGSFFWARSRELFTDRPWRSVDRRWYGLESTPGVWFRPDEAGCLFWEGVQATLDLYRMDLMKEVLLSYALWRAENEGMRTERMVRAS